MRELLLRYGDRERMSAELEPETSRTERRECVVCWYLLLAPLVVMPLKQGTVVHLCVVGQHDATFAASDGFLRLQTPSRRVAESTGKFAVHFCTVRVRAIFHQTQVVIPANRGLQLLSEQNHWLHQRCHFHLLATLVRGKSKRRYRTRSSNLRDKILEATRIILGSQNERILQRARKIMRTLINRPVCPPYIRKQALEFLEREQDFQTYLRYPSLHLPTTTSAIESTGRMVRRATRTARTPQSLLLRATTFLRLKKHVICNGNINQI